MRNEKWLFNEKMSMIMCEEPENPYYKPVAVLSGSEQEKKENGKKIIDTFSFVNVLKEVIAEKDKVFEHIQEKLYEDAKEIQVLKNINEDNKNFIKIYRRTIIEKDGMLDGMLEDVEYLLEGGL